MPIARRYLLIRFRFVWQITEQPIVYYVIKRLLRVVRVLRLNDDFRSGAIQARDMSTCSLIQQVSVPCEKQVTAAATFDSSIFQLTSSKITTNWMKLSWEKKPTLRCQKSPVACFMFISRGNKGFRNSNMSTLCIFVLCVANGKIQGDRTRDEDKGLLERGTCVNGESRSKGKRKGGHQQLALGKRRHWHCNCDAFQFQFEINLQSYSICFIYFDCSTELLTFWGWQSSVGCLWLDFSF